MTSGPRVGLIELPAIKLVDREGHNWTALRRNEPLVSKQILIPQLRSCGFDARMVNLKEASDEIEYGEVQWRDKTLTKVLVGSMEINPTDYDVWGVTIN